MADRTLVAYERQDGFETHYAHDRVRPGRLGPETPAGGDADRDLSRLRAALADRRIVLGADHGGSAVDPEPLQSGLSWPAVVERIDYRTYDRCLRVVRDWSTTAFLVLWFGFEPRGGAARDPSGDGALLAVADDDRDESYDRGWFEGVKSATADALRRGIVDESGARAYLTERVREAAGEREVYVAGR